MKDISIIENGFKCWVLRYELKGKRYMQGFQSLAQCTRFLELMEEYTQ